MRQLGEPVRGGATLQVLGQACVPALPAQRGVGRLDRVLDEGVAEAHGAVLGVDDDEPAGHGGLERVEHLVDAGAVQRGQQLQVEVPGQRGGGPQQLLRGLRQGGEPGGDHVAHAGRHPGPGVRRAQTLPPAQQLDDVERVAAGAVAQPAGLVGVHHGLPGGVGEDLHLVGVQAGEVQPEDLAARQARDEVGERAGRLREGPTGHEDDEPALVEVLHEVLEQPERRGVCPVQVVQHQQHRLLLRRPDERVEDAVEEPETVGEALRGRGEQLVGGRHGYAWTSLGQPAQHAGPGPQRRCSLVRRAATGQHEKTLVPGDGGELGAQPALADPCLADQRGEPGHAGGRPRQQLLERRQLAGAPDQRRTGR